MARRKVDKNGLDYYRTPRWATRALLNNLHEFDLMRNDFSCLDPCAGELDMSRVLEEDFGLVTTMDIKNHGGVKLDYQRDFLSMESVAPHDW